MSDVRKNTRPNNNRFRPNRNNVRRENSKAEYFTLRIEKMVQGGEGMTHLEDGRVCFVAGALPGELCKVRLTFQKKDFTKGRVVEVLEANADRVMPRCPHYGKCGGCSLQHLASAKQAEYLENVERENFKRLAHADLPTDFFIHTGSAWGYRNRARVVCRKSPDGRCTFGFRGEESNEIVPFKNCLVLTEGLNAFLQGSASALLSNCRRDIDVNLFDNGMGEISLYYQGMSKSDFDAHAVSHVEIAGRKIEADASVFFQSNLGLLPELVESVRNAVDEGLASGKSTDDWLIDLFSGVGFFACILQDKFKRITTVEREEGCLKHARVNLDKRTLAGSLQTTNAKDERIIENVSAPAEDWLLENVVDIPATLVVDPPRTGLPKEALTAIVKSSVNRLIYVSCDPVTLARDFAKFSEAGFNLSHAEGFAFYPQTPHLEMMFVLDR